jgi:hypothetical protein
MALARERGVDRCGGSGCRRRIHLRAGVARSSIPLQWSILGIPRTTTIELGYTVAFEVTPEDFATECEPATAR